MTKQYDFSNITISALDTDVLQDSLTSIGPYTTDTIAVGAVGSNGTSATDLIWGNGTSPSVVGGVTWTTTPSSIGTGTYTINSTDLWRSNTAISQGGAITLQGDNADININGKSMKAWMEKVEERLNILTPNTELEKEWDDLRELGERYRELEKRCKEKAEVWKKLNSMPPPEVK